MRTIPIFNSTEQAIVFAKTMTDKDREYLVRRRRRFLDAALDCRQVKTAIIKICRAQFDREAVETYDSFG